MSQTTVICPKGHRVDPRAAEAGVCGLCGEPIGTPTTPSPPPSAAAGADIVRDGMTLVVPECSAAPVVVAQDAGHSFTIIQLHGVGGNGVVSLAQDHVLERKVAIKQIRGPQKSHPLVRQRFIKEACITGQLEHPGIVPIYGLERDAAGDPFLVMKFIQGRTLKEAIAEYRQAPTSAGLSELLRRFENVCQTLAYAHSKGVIHRDLKPANIMLGDYGETLVLDWGLAKKVQPAAAVQEQALRSLGPVPTSDSDGLTSGGQAVGTPGFMAPEVARGEPSDERADVFGLGAILCQILTGRSAVVADSIAGIIDRTAAGDLSETQERLRTCGADPELVALALACLAAERAQRPPQAGAVAERLSRYLASVQERLQTAEVARAQAQARASEEYKRRRLTVLLGAALILLVAAAALGWFWYEKREAERRHEAEMARAQGHSLLQTGHLDRAEVALQRGLQLSANLLGVETLRASLKETMQVVQRAKQAQQLHELATWLHFYSAEDFLPQRGWFVLDAGCRHLWPQRNQLAHAGHLPPLEQKLERSIREDLLGVAILWGELQVRLAGSQQVAAARRAALTLLAEAEASLGANVVLLEARARHADELGLDDIARQAASEAKEQPPRSAWDYYGLGRIHLARGDLEQAWQALQKAIVEQPDNFAAHFLLGVAAYRRGRYPEALSAFSFCIGQEPKAECYYYRGKAAAALNELDQAARDFDLALHKKPAFGPAYLQRAILYVRQQRFDEALADLHRALQNESDPASTHYQLAQVHLAQNRPGEARSHLQQALKLQPRHPEALRLQKQMPPP